MTGLTFDEYVDLMCTLEDAERRFLAAGQERGAAEVADFMTALEMQRAGFELPAEYAALVAAPMSLVN